MADDYPPRAMAVDCPWCDKAVVAEPVGWVVHDDPWDNDPAERFTLMRCPMSHPILVDQGQYSEYGIFNSDAPWRMYPPQDRPLSTEIPEVLLDAHEEARKCFRAKSYVGAVILCGRTLEAACKANDVATGSLEAKLEKMREKGLIDGRLLDRADTLRQVRNAASHADDARLTRQAAEDVLAYGEALLDYLYVMKARFDALKARRAAAPESG